MRDRRRLHWVPGMVVTLVMVSGCTALTPKERVLVSAKTDLDYMRQDIERINQRLAAIESEQADLRSAISTERQSSEKRRAALRKEMDDIHRSIRAIDAARKKDVEDIVARLSKKIVHAINSQRAGDRVYDAETGQHVVQKGETLSGIAEAYGVTVDAIMQENGLKRANLIRVGQKLKIPQ